MPVTRAIADMIAGQGVITPSYTIQDGQIILTTGTITTSKPAVSATQTWNNAAEVFVLDSMNVTDTASAAASSLFERKIGGASKLFLKKNGDFGIGTNDPSAKLDLRGSAYFYSTTSLSNPASAAQFQSVLANAASVYGLRVDTVHNNDTGDVYGFLGVASKNTNKTGNVLAVEGFVNVAHQANNSRHYGLTGDSRSIANGKTGTKNVGSWNIASGADSNVGTLITALATDAPPDSGDWAIYALTATQNSYFAGSVFLGSAAGNANAILDLTSTTKAFIPPRMTAAQRDAISDPILGMVVVNTDTGKLNIRGASAWEAITSA